MPDKLGLYNDALLHLGQTKLVSLTEDVTSRYALDDAWDNTVKYCLEQGFWNHAMRVIQIDSSTSVTPTFGWEFAFAKPSDWLRTHQVSADETFATPLLRFNDEPNYWFADVDPLFIRYVSNANSYGMDLSLWPATYANYVATRLAKRTCKRITGSSDGVKELEKAETRAKADAGAKDAMNEPPGFGPRGSWVLSRGGPRGGSDRGLR